VKAFTVASADTQTAEMLATSISENGIFSNSICLPADHPGTRRKGFSGTGEL
jgi:hypothetical protein